MTSDIGLINYSVPIENDTYYNISISVMTGKYTIQYTYQDFTRSCDITGYHNNVCLLNQLIHILIAGSSMIM